ncbi:MAG: FtsX-like permease family protein, partial [Ferruginibacter sp.]
TGRYFSAAEFNNGTNSCVMGYTLAENLFGFPDAAIGKQVDIKGQKVTVIGVIEKEGKSFIGMDHDDCVMLTYNFSRRIINVLQTNPIIIAKGKEGVPSVALVSELEGIMRQIRKLSPKQEDNFTLNSVEAISKSLSQSFVMINVVGAIIGGISLIVGMFGIANIMFVTVKERTSVIGLKKAIGAKKRSILFEFLMEAAILCVIGGAFGLLLVYILTLILSGPLNFPVFISVPLMAFTVVLCIVIGILAGIIPAAKASNLDPVVAIRS